MNQLDWFLQQNIAGQFVGSRNQSMANWEKSLNAKKNKKKEIYCFFLKMFLSKDFSIISYSVADRQTVEINCSAVVVHRSARRSWHQHIRSCSWWYQVHQSLVHLRLWSQAIRSSKKDFFCLTQFSLNLSQFYRFWKPKVNVGKGAT